MHGIGFGSTDETEQAYGNVKDKVMEALRDQFRPEFLNRLDEVIVFNILPQEAIKQIVEIQLDAVHARLADKEITLKLSPAALDHLAEKGFSPTYGARPLKRLIQDKILTKIAQLMVSKGILEGGVVSVDVKKNADGEDDLSFTVTKKGKAPTKKRVSKGKKETVKA